MRTAFPSEFLKVADLDGRDLILTIASVKMVDLPNSDETKPVVYFEEKKQGLVLNRTNNKSIQKLLGWDSAKWVGCSITLFETDVPFKGDVVAAIRIKSQRGAVNEPIAVGAKATKAKQAQSRAKMLDRMELVDAVRQENPFRFRFSNFWKFFHMVSLNRVTYSCST